MTDFTPGVYVCATRCDACLLSPERVVSSRRAADIISDCRNQDTFFVCHKWTLAAEAGESTPYGGKVACRGFFDLEPDTAAFRIARRMDALHFIERPETGIVQDDAV